MDTFHKTTLVNRKTTLVENITNRFLLKLMNKNIFKLIYKTFLQLKRFKRPILNKFCYFKVT